VAKTIGCERTSQRNACLYDVRTDVHAPIVGRQSTDGGARVINGAEGWIAMKPERPAPKEPTP